MIRYTVHRDDWDETSPDLSLVAKLITRHISDAMRYTTLEDYYAGQHAILGRHRGEGAPNNRIAVNWAKYITDTATGYFLANPITYTSSTGEDISPLLLAYDRAHTDDTDADNAFELSRNGSAYEYVYAAEGEADLSSRNLCARNTFVVTDTSIDERELFGVYYRTIQNSKTDQPEYAATICTANYIYDVRITRDGTPISKAGDPRPHYMGEVPIIAYSNNHDGMGDYEQLIPLIDAYNTLMSDRVNDVQDYVDAILIVYGTLLADEPEETEEGSEGGTPAAKKSLRDGKLLEFPDKQSMGAEWLTRQLDENGVEVLQQAIARDILRMAYVPDFADEKFAGNSSGVAIAYKCLLLEWLTKTKERYYRKGLRKRSRLFARYLGLKQITVHADSIVPHFARSLPTNKAETAQIVATLAGKVSQRTLLQQLDFVEDPDAEIAALKKEAEHQQPPNNTDNQGAGDARLF